MKWKPAKIIAQADEPRSYIVQTEDGRYRRNRSFIKELPRKEAVDQEKSNQTSADNNIDLPEQDTPVEPDQPKQPDKKQTTPQPIRKSSRVKQQTKRLIEEY